MASTASPSLLPGQSPPLLVISSTDKGGVILIVTALGLAFALVSLLIRAYVRYEFSPTRFAWDDAIIVGAMAFSIFQNACVFLAVHKGLGKTIDQISPQDLIAIQKAGYADDILYIISVWLTKVSVAFLFLRLSPKRGHMLVSRLDAIIAAVTGAVSILIVALRCNLSHPWININSHNAQCTGLFARWQTVAAFDITLEILIFATSGYLLYALQMTIFKKSAVLTGFALRLPLVIPIALRLHYLSLALNSSNYTLQVTNAAICKQVEIAYSIVAATIPCLRPFMTATATHYGAPAEGPRTKQGTYGAYGKSSNSSTSQKKQERRNGGFQLASLTSRLSPGRGNASKMNSSQPSQLRNGLDTYGNHTASVVAGGGSRARDTQSVGSTESKQMIIRKDVDYSVEYDSRQTSDVERYREGDVERSGVGMAK